MSVEKVKGIVLKEYISGESSKRIVVLTEEMGKLTLNVKGAKNVRSKLAASSQLFCYSSFVVYEGKGFYSVTQADVIESFYDLRNDIIKLSFCTYLLELTERTHFEGTESREVLKLLLRTLSVIEKTGYDVLLAVSIFEIKLLQLGGFIGFYGKCLRCMGQFKDIYYFSPSNGGIICGECGKKVLGAVPILRGTFLALTYVMGNSGRRIFAFNVSKEINVELRAILEKYIAENIGQNFKTLSFAKNCLHI